MPAASTSKSKYCHSRARDRINEILEGLSSDPPSQLMKSMGGMVFGALGKSGCLEDGREC